MLDKILKYKSPLLVALVVLIVVIVVRMFWKRAGNNTVKVVDDNGHEVSFTAEQRSQAKSIAERINKDLNSGWLFGANFLTGNEFGINNGTRDDEAYTALAQMSDSLFALTVQTYMDVYKSSLITDLRNESSLDTHEYKATILAKADRLKIG